MIFQSNFFVNIHVLVCWDAEQPRIGRSREDLAILRVNVKSLDGLEGELKATSSQICVLLLGFFFFLPFF